MKTKILCHLLFILMIWGCDSKDKEEQYSASADSLLSSLNTEGKSPNDSSLAPLEKRFKSLPLSEDFKENIQNVIVPNLKQSKKTEAAMKVINYLAEANKKFEEKDYAGSIPLFDKELEINPSNAEAFDKRIQAKAELSKPKEKIDQATIEHIVEVKTHLEALMHDAEHKFRISDYRGAINDYNAIIDQKLSTNCEVYYKRGLAKAEFGKYQDAIIDFNKAIELFPAYSDAYFRRALCKTHLEEYKEAIPDFSHVIKLHPQDKVGYFNRGLTKGLAKDYKGAVTDFSKSIEIDSVYEDAYFHRAEALGSIGKLNEAIKDLTFVIELNPHSKLAFYNRGQLYMEEFLYPEAIVDFSKVTELNPHDEEAYYFKGIAEMDMNKMSEACISLKKAEELGDKRAAALIEKTCK
jgi:tetratricopeptide (TPR) repeat protein